MRCSHRDKAHLQVFFSSRHWSASPFHLPTSCQQFVSKRGNLWTYGQALSAIHHFSVSEMEGLSGILIYFMSPCEYLNNKCPKCQNDVLSDTFLILLFTAYGYISIPPFLKWNRTCYSSSHKLFYNRWIFGNRPVCYQWQDRSSNHNNRSQNQFLPHWNKMLKIFLLTHRTLCTCSVFDLVGQQEEIY